MKTSLAFLATAGAAALFLFAAGCGAKRGNGESSELPTATVEVQTVELKSRAATENEIGTVRPKLSAVIEAKISGSIKSMAAVPGQSVKRGDLLAELNANEIQARYDQAAAALKQAEQDWQRTSKLYEEQAAARADYDAAEARYRVAQAAVAEAQTMMGYVEIHAPFDGIITRKDADVGDLAAPGKPLAELEDPSHLRLEADVPDELRDRVKIGDALSVTVDVLDTNLTGIVSEIAPSSDPNSRTFVVKLDLPPAPGLNSGEFGRVCVPIGEVSALRVADSAVIQRGGMEFLFVVAGKSAQLRIVKTGEHIGNEVEIVAGLNSGEQVVVSGADQLLDGQPVVIKP